MKTVIKYRFFIMAIILTVSYSCSDDLGNYEYSEINEVSVNLEDSYDVFFGRPFLLEPELSSTLEKDENSYSFEWYAYENGVVVGDLDTEPLAITKDLDFENLPLAPGSYNMVYRIMDKETEVEWIDSFKLTVESAVSKGWLVLNDINGEPRLDMISRYEGSDHLLYDVLMATNSELDLEGAPIDVMTYGYEPGFYGVYITTEGNGTTKVDPTTFGWEETLRLSYEMLGDFPTDFAADFIHRQEIPHSSLMYKDGDVYYYYRTVQYRYSTPINSIEGTTFKVAPYISESPLLVGANILYDEDNQRFVRHVMGQTGAAVMPDGELFDYNTGKDLVYMTQSHYNNGETFALLHDSINDELYLVRIMSDGSGVSQRYYDQIPEDIAGDMVQSKEFAVSPDYGYIFYENNGKVYEYDFSLKTSKLMIDKPNSDITVLKFEYDSTNPKDLLVGSFDEVTHEGVIELYSVPPVNGDLELEKSFDGFGKIKSIAYKEEGEE